jgi:hypothetical protein
VKKSQATMPAACARKNSRQLGPARPRAPVSTCAREEEFAPAAVRVTHWLADQRGTIPTFVFVDPFGFTGVPLEAIKALMSVAHVEVLLTRQGAAS